MSLAWSTYYSQPHKWTGMEKHVLGENYIAWITLTASTWLFDGYCEKVMLLYIIEKLDSTHQSFTLVFLCFFRLAGRF